MSSASKQKGSAHDPLCPEDWFCICSYLYKADARAREQAAQRVNECRTDLRGYVDKVAAVAAAKGDQA